MISVLSIGNSFSQDAQRYLHGAAQAGGHALTCVNLYIGGCSLWRHFRNLQADAPDYELEFNGESTGFRTDIRTALLSRPWDYVTVQQVSQDARDYGTFQPWLDTLAAEIRRLAPCARLAVHQTWAYAAGSERLTRELGYAAPEVMQRDVETACAQAASEIRAELVIPGGRAMLALERSGVTAHRDGFHASLGAGRYALALTWYHALTGAPIGVNGFDRFDVPVTAQEAAAARAAAVAAFGGEADA